MMHGTTNIKLLEDI